MTSKNSTAIIFTYMEPHHHLGSKHFLKINNGKLQDNFVKYEIQVEVGQIDVYVAPTDIDLVNPTFWATKKRHEPSPRL